MENSKEDLIKTLPFTQKLILIGVNSILENEELLYVNEERIIKSMTMACSFRGLPHSKMKIKNWLQELECYCLVKINVRKDKETRIMLCVSGR